MNFKINSRPLFTIILKLKNDNFKTRDFSPLIERVLAGVECLKMCLRNIWMGTLVRTYIYNEEYDAQNIVVEAAIECVGALASKLCWKKYAKLLQQFLSQVSGQISTF